MGDRDTAVIVSIAVLVGHDLSPDSPPSVALPEPAEATGAGDTGAGHTGSLTLIGQTNSGLSVSRPSPMVTAAGRPPVAALPVLATMA